MSQPWLFLAIIAAGLVAALVVILLAYLGRKS